MGRALPRWWRRWCGLRGWVHLPNFVFDCGVTVTGVEVDLVVRVGKLPVGTGWTV